MNSSELKAAITEADIHPVLVIGPIDSEDGIPLVSGDLDEFLAVAKVLQAKAVFFHMQIFDENVFLIDTSESGGGDEEEEEGQEGAFIDLRKLAPKIGAFKAHLGEGCAFLLSAEGGVAKLGYLLEESWFQEFKAERATALEEWAERRGERLAEADETWAKKKEELKESLRSLLEDARFVAIRTQQGMRAYALRMIPGLDDLDEGELKAEIQALKGEVDAQCLNRKRH